MNTNKLIHKIRTAPKALTIPVALFVGVLILAGAAAMMPHGSPSTMTTAVTPITHKPPASSAAPEAAPPPPVSTGVARTAQVSTQSKPAPSSAVASSGPVSMRVVLPGTEAPAGLVEQRSAYRLEVAQRRGYGQYGDTATIGAQTVEARASSFGAFPVRALREVVPAGKAREEWTFYTNVETAGVHLFALKMMGSGGDGAVLVDGQARPVVTVSQCCNRPTTGVGQIDLGAGWHRVTVQMSHPSRSNSQPGEVTASLFVRGPNDSAPKSITPFAIDESATDSMPASSASAGLAPHAGEVK